MKSYLSALAAMAALAIPAHAYAGDTFAKIKEYGNIKLGYREVSIPFSYLDSDQKPIGFAMDLCGRIVDAVKAELKLPNLQTRLQPVQLGNQIPLIENGTIDIVCGPATNTLERQKVVAFSDTIFVSSIRAVVRNDAAIRTFEDLDGKTISLTNGSTAINLLAVRAQAKGFKTNNVMSADHAASFLALTTGRTTAFAMDDVLLASVVANSTKPGDWRIIEDSLRDEPYGLIIRKDDPAFKVLVDRTLVGLMKGGEFDRLYAKWFTSPIPPKGIDLNFPMSRTLKEAVANPNDKGV